MTPGRITVIRDRECGLLSANRLDEDHIVAIVLAMPQRSDLAASADGLLGCTVIEPVRFQNAHELRFLAPGNAPDYQRFAPQIEVGIVRPALTKDERFTVLRDEPIGIEASAE